MFKVYGIPNCDTIKKTQKWLDGKQVKFESHNYRKDGVDRDTLEKWLDQQPLEKLLNKASTTFKALSDDAKQAALTREGAIELMLEKPTVIKRPVIENADGKVVAIGFKEAEYEELFSAE